MGSTRICACWHKYGQTIIYCLILFASTSIFSTHFVFMAEGRPISHLIGVAQNNNGMKERERGSVLVANKFQVIGSRPPRCERRCSTCGHCEAVQVPVVPQVQSRRSHSEAAPARARTRARSRSAATTYSRGDDLSNYKPMSWKCKCGNYFFNP